jgi:hypothetical protein
VITDSEGNVSLDGAVAPITWAVSFPRVHAIP